jgi:hypothetical protein
MKKELKVICNLCYSVISEGICGCSNVAIITTEEYTNLYIDDLSTIDLVSVIVNSENRVVFSEKIFMYPLTKLKGIKCLK